MTSPSPSMMSPPTAQTMVQPRKTVTPNAIIPAEGPELWANDEEAPHSVRVQAAQTVLKKIEDMTVPLDDDPMIDAIMDADLTGEGEEYRDAL